MKLLVVESPTKTKSISKYVGSNYEVLSTMGHLRDLPKSKMGIEIEEGKTGLVFKPNYGVVKGRGDQAKKLKAVAKKADGIILATDPDREGEAIAWHVMQLLGGSSDKYGRIVFHSITKEAVLEALTKPREIDMDLVNAQQARRVLDRLVGYKLSPVLWYKVRKGLSAGRVQSVAVRLIVEREREIEAFKSQEYWEIKVKLKSTQSDSFWVDLVRIGGKKVEVVSKNEAETIEADLKKADYEVGEVVRKERKRYPYPPFKTSTMQQAAANVLGWSSKKTMSVAQKLYELGKITYHRTDSLNLVPSALEEIRQFIKSEWGEEYLPKVARFYKTSGKVVAQEAHEAIRPTEMSLGTKNFKGEGQMASDQEKLYSLIWRRSIACQMAEAIYDTMKIVVVAKSKQDYQLQTLGEIEKFAGWRKLYSHETETILLPEVVKEEKLKMEKVETAQKFTQPPARYNDASLIKELEKRGIGRPSTYAPTISTIIVRRYIERIDKRFFPTAIGKAVANFLVANFPQELDYAFTAKMESDLDEIAKGKLEWMKMLSDFFGPFEKKVKDVEKNSKRVGVAAEGTGKECPDCKEGEVVIREGKFGRFYSCSRYPECKYTARMIEYAEGINCEKCGGRVVVKKTRTGRTFYGCENYPKCDYASWTRPLPHSDGTVERHKKLDGKGKMKN